MKTRFSRILPAEVDILRQLAISSFEKAFAEQNTAADMQAYIGRAFSSETLLSSLEDPSSQSYFVEQEGKPAGYFKLNFGKSQTDLQDPEALEIERLYILAEYQSQGLGSRCLAHIREIALQLGLRYIWLGVWEKNTGAIRMYERAGFVKSGMHDFMLGEDLQHDFIMKWELDRP